MYRGSIKFIASGLQLAAHSYSMISRIYPWKAGTLSFHPIHKFHPNLSEEWCQKRINSGRTVWDYLSASYKCSRTEAGIGHELHVKGHKSVKSDKKDFPKTLFKSMELHLKPFVDTVPQGLHFTLSDQAQIFFSFLLTSYIADISECEAMLSVKRGSITTSRFQSWSTNVASLTQLKLQKDEFLRTAHCWMKQAKVFCLFNKPLQNIQYFSFCQFYITSQWWVPTIL